VKTGPSKREVTSFIVKRLLIQGQCLLIEGFFAQVMTMGKRQILARVIGIGKEKCR